MWKSISRKCNCCSVKLQFVFLWIFFLLLLQKRIKIFHTAVSFVYRPTSYRVHIFFTANNASCNFSTVKCVKFEAYALRSGIKRVFAVTLKHSYAQILDNFLVCLDPASLSFILFFFRQTHITYCTYEYEIARLMHEPLCSLVTPFATTNSLRTCTMLLNYVRREHRCSWRF